MLKQDNLHFDAIDRLQTGIAKVAKAVGSTMGTGGGNAILEAIESPGHLTTNDGYSIANSIVLADPIEDMGRKILLEAINRANKQSGDGSSTTCVLTDAVLKEGRKQEGHHPMDIKRSLEECLPLIEANLKEQSREVTVDNVEQVATISAEDATIGKMIGDIYKQIGPTGIIHWDVSKTANDQYTIGQGITVNDAGFLSPYMCDANEGGQSTNQIRINDPYILITKQKIASGADFEKIGAELYGKEVRDLVVFCEDIDPLVVNDLVKTRMMRGFRFAIVKMPVLWKDWWYEDLAKATGATVVDPAAGFPLKSLQMNHLGRVGNIIIARDETYLDGIADVSEHIKTLEDEGSDESLLRASRLNTKTARYFVGAHSDSALSYRRLKVEDAISASYQALNGGIVAGGGVALINAIKALPKGVGGKVLWDALKAPTAQIIRNAGGEPLTGGNAVMVGADLIGGTHGYDTKNKAIVDMFDAGIVDPTNIVINAVKNAVSVAATILTAPTLVTLPREEAPSQGQLSPSNAIVR